MHEPTERLVTSYYLDVLNGSLLRAAPDARGSVEHAMRIAARTIRPGELADLRRRGWREALMAGWWTAVLGDRTMLRPLGEQLLASETSYASQTATVALARLGADGEDEAIDYLDDYLDLYLERTDLEYDQRWALGALVVTDAARRTDRAAPYLTPGGPWERWLAAQSARGSIADRPQPADVAAAWASDLGTLLDLARSLDPAT